MKVNVGDFITLYPLEVVHVDGAEKINVRWPHGGGVLTVNGSQIASVESAPPQPGDEITWGDHSGSVVVVYIHGNQHVVKSNTGRLSVHLRDNMNRLKIIKRAEK